MPVFVCVSVSPHGMNSGVRLCVLPFRRDGLAIINIWPRVFSYDTYTTPSTPLSPAEVNGFTTNDGKTLRGEPRGTAYSACIPTISRVP